MDLNGVYVDYGLWIIFGTVLLQQLGVPIPVFPLLIFAGAQAVERPMHVAVPPPASRHLEVMLLVAAAALN